MKIQKSDFSQSELEEAGFCVLMLNVRSSVSGSCVMLAAASFHVSADTDVWSLLLSDSTTLIFPSFSNSQSSAAAGVDTGDIIHFC